MPYHHDIEACRAEKIGDGGVSEAALKTALGDLAPSLERLRKAQNDGTMPILNIAQACDDLEEIAEVAGRYRRDATDVVVLGTGGSSLGGKCFSALGRDDAAPALHFLENVDPDGFMAALDRLDLSRTGVLIISKSGTTAETLSQALALLPSLSKAQGADGLSGAVTVISDPPADGEALSPLRILARDLGSPVLDHRPGIGGRFAALTNVGLIPAAIAGLSPEKIRAGAAKVLDATLGATDPEDAPPAVGAALNIAIARERNISQTVMMPYPDRLAPFSAWFRQIWGESLGKEGKGTTPLAALGTVDQHSQLQLWLDGPADKLFTLVFGQSAGSGPELAPMGNAWPDLDWMRGRRLGDLLDAEQVATRDGLVAKGRPVRVITVNGADEATLGALMMHFMLETILAADLLGVDPFDQPAVEAGKVLAREKMVEMGRDQDHGGGS
jgi:glucose-6-phosphate isomerase